MKHHARPNRVMPSMSPFKPQGSTQIEPQFLMFLGHVLVLDKSISFHATFIALLSRTQVTGTLRIQQNILNDQANYADCLLWEGRRHRQSNSNRHPLLGPLMYRRWSSPLLLFSHSPCSSSSYGYALLFLVQDWAHPKPGSGASFIRI